MRVYLPPNYSEQPTETLLSHVFSQERAGINTSIVVQPTEKLLILAGLCHHSIENSVYHENIDKFRAELLRSASAQLCVAYSCPPEIADTRNTT